MILAGAVGIIREGSGVGGMRCCVPPGTSAFSGGSRADAALSFEFTWQVSPVQACPSTVDGEAAGVGGVIIPH
jgi:hypothetical protein